MTTHPHDQFRQDMEDDGRWDVEDYNGRSYWSGPAIRIEDAAELQDVIRATTVKLQWDSMGRAGMIVYPAAYRRKPEQVSP